jgi:5'-methylthioadenosine phosphorylase
MLKIGIIGGSGLENHDFFTPNIEVEMNTPYGKPSSTLKIGNISGTEVILLSRHGKNHDIPPSQVNYRANLYALKEMGCTHILATSAVGSLKEEIKPGNLVFPSQFLDFTKQRKLTYHDTAGNVVHTAMAEPYDKQMRDLLVRLSQELNLPYNSDKTLIIIEGPRFSTKAESRMFRLLGADIIGMTGVPEVTLANELGIPYQTIAMSTDYDCWKDDEDPVTWDIIKRRMKENSDKVLKLFKETIAQLSKETITGSAPKRSDLDLKQFIRTVPNWPKLGIMFRDITTLLQDPKAFRCSITRLKEHYQNIPLTKIVGIESRGFIFGAALAYELNLPFILIRKKGKLPAETISQEYTLEYGTDRIEIHKDALTPHDLVLITDDLLATGGTAKAACQLVEKLGAKVAGTAFIVNLPELKGTEQIKQYNPFFLVEFEGE